MHLSLVKSILSGSVYCGLLCYSPVLAQSATTQQMTVTVTDTVATAYQVFNAKCALFPAGASMDIMHDSIANTGRFMPTLQQVTVVEKALPKVDLRRLYEYPAPANYYAHYPALIKKRFKQFYRQYYGFYNAQHQSCLFINLFIYTNEDAPSRVPYWLRTRVYVYDGGSAYWRIYYNIATGQFYNFSHNGEG